MQKSGQGLPKCVLQEEKTSPSDIQAVCGTVKAAVLEGFLSTICESIKWIQCEKPVFCVETEQVENMKFLRLNIKDDYNHDMGRCDIADQLRNYYHFDHWMRKRKWWWSFFFWATGALLVNTYISYKTYMISKGMQPMTHYEFRKAIALAWLDPFPSTGTTGCKIETRVEHCQQQHQGIETQIQQHHPFHHDPFHHIVSHLNFW